MNIQERLQTLEIYTRFRAGEVPDTIRWAIQTIQQQAEEIEKLKDVKMNDVPFIRFGGEKFVRMALLKEGSGIIKRQADEIAELEQTIDSMRKAGLK